MNKAIIIPANPHPKGGGRWMGGASVGKILPHMTFIKKHGAVFWGFGGGQSINNMEDIKKGYFYITPDKSVKFVFDIDYIKIKKSIPKKDINYIPEWRKWDWKNYGEGYYIKISKITQLKKSRRLSDFVKISDDKRVRRVQCYVIVKDPNYKTEKRSINSREIVNDIIDNCIKDGRISERDIEDIFEHMLFDKNYEYIGRQDDYRNDRIDIVYKDKCDNFIICEIKKSTADFQTLNQIKRYIKKIKKEHKPKNITGIILCKDATPKLENLVKKEKYIKIQKFRFSVDFEDLMKK